MMVEIEITDEMYDTILRNELRTVMEYSDDITVALAARVLWGNYYGFGELPQESNDPSSIGE